MGRTVNLELNDGWVDLNPLDKQLETKYAHPWNPPKNPASKLVADARNKVPEPLHVLFCHREHEKAGHISVASRSNAAKCFVMGRRF